MSTQDIYERPLCSMFVKRVSNYFLLSIFYNKTAKMNCSLKNRVRRNRAIGEGSILLPMKVDKKEETVPYNVI